MDKDGRGFKPPDGGYGWIVILACVIINSTLLPLTQCFGIIYANKFMVMNISAAEISFLLHLHNSIMCSLGLFSGPLLKKFNFRQVSFMGTSLVCLGIFLTVFAQSYSTLIFTISIIIGTGQGILMPATYVAVNTYFKERLTLAVGLQVTGVSISPIVVPYIIVWLLDEYGTRGTVLVLSAISLHALPAVILLRPVKKHKSLKNPDSLKHPDPLRKSEKLKNASSLEKSPKETKNGLTNEEDRETIISLLDPNSSLQQQEVYKETTLPKKKESVFKDICRIFNFDLLLDVGYIVIIVGMGVSFASELNVVLMMPFILAEFAKFDKPDVGLAMSIQAAADVLGRLLIPIISHKSGWSAKLMYGCALIGSSVGRTILAVFNDERNTVLASIVFIGISKGAKAVFQSLIIPKYVAFEDLAAATGLSMVANGILSLIIGPIIGVTHDVTSSYAVTLHVATLLSLMCVTLWIADNYIRPKEKPLPIEEGP